MATVTLGVTTASTSNATSYAAGSITPAAGDFIVALITTTGQTGALGVTDNQAGSAGWTQVAISTFNTTESIHAWVRNNVATNTAMVVTATCATATGCTITLYRIAGAGLTYRQANAASGALSTTPTVTLSVAADTNNPLVAACGNEASPATLTPRSSPVWTESSDTGYNSPTAGHECMFINSGETASSIAWGGTSATAWGAVVVEVYNSTTGMKPDDSVHSGGYYGLSQSI